jgi:hypothetical protein
LGKLHDSNEYWSALSQTHYDDTLLLDEMNLDDEDSLPTDTVLMEAKDMLNRLQNKSHRRGKPERSLRRTQAWT